MIHHYITKYEEHGNIYAEAWIQLDLFGRCWFLHRRINEIKGSRWLRENERRLS